MPPSVTVLPTRAPIGVVIAGGRAARLGGGDKTLLMIGQQPILGRLIERIKPQCAGLVLSANGDPDRFRAFGLPVVRDAPEDAGRGPLAGVLAALDWIAIHRPEARDALVVPGDTPFLPSDLVERLAAVRARDGATLAAARSGARDHPLVALWPTDLRTDLRQALRHDAVRRVLGFLARTTVAWAEWEDQPADPFLNINTPQDIDVAGRRAGASD